VLLRARHPRSFRRCQVAGQRRRIGQHRSHPSIDDLGRRQHQIDVASQAANANVGRGKTSHQSAALWRSVRSDRPTAALSLRECPLLDADTSSGESASASPLAVNVAKGSAFAPMVRKPRDQRLGCCKKPLRNVGFPGGIPETGLSRIHQRQTLTGYPRSFASIGRSAIGTSPSSTSQNPATAAGPAST